jgi:O-Antigen ligase
MNAPSFLLREASVGLALLFAFVAAQIFDSLYLGHSMYALYILGGLLVLFAATLIPVRIPHAPVLVMTSLVLLLDNPSERPFNDVDQVTQIMGRWLFIPLQRFTEIPIPVSLFELAAVVFGGVALVRIFRRYLLGKTDVSWIGCAVPMLLMVVWGVALGMFRGGDITDAIFQSRCQPFFFLWGVAAWEYFRTEQQLWVLLSTVTVCSFIKAIQGLLVWYFVWGAGAEEHRYIIDHFYSDAFMHTSIFLVGSLLLPSKRLLGTRILFRLPILAIILFAAYLNNRRTAYIGLAFSGLVLPFFIAPHVIKRYAKPLIIVLLCGGMIGGLMIFRKAMICTGSSAITDTSAFYRVQENLNLLELIREHPFLGGGFGRPMPLLHEMASVAEAYKQYALMPHNNVLFIWAFMGPLGIMLFSVYCQQALATCVRYGTTVEGYLLWENIRSRLIAFLVASQLIRWMLYVYADLGLIGPRFIFLVSVSVAGITRLHTKGIVAQKAKG